MNADGRAELKRTRRSRRRLLAVSALLLGGIVGGAAPQGLFAQELRPGISLQQAVEIAMRERPGRVVRAVTVTAGGMRVHEVRILLDEGGRVVTIRVDARTGRVD
jgi:uncharacterized membrane protein YkoI